MVIFMDIWGLMRSFMLLNYVARVNLLREFNLWTADYKKKRHEDILVDVFQKLEIEGRLKEFEKRVKEKGETV